VPKVSVTVITRNEASNIGDALASVAWSDDVVVVDSESTDDTVEIARAHGARVFVNAWPGYGAQKNYAADLARHDWILSLDADERVTPALAREIQQALAREPSVSGYRIPRVARHLGRWIRTTDWYPNRKLRLYDRRRARWDETQRVHETLHLKGQVGTLRSELEHHTYRDLSHQLTTLDRYSTLAARDLHEQGVRARALDVVVLPPLTFFRNYVARRGFLDGLPGLIVSAQNAHYVLLKYAKLWELQRSGTAAPSRETGVPSTHQAPRTPSPPSTRHHAPGTDADL
jgi:glycosyltransferase involved in cell wall biosynthesis